MTPSFDGLFLLTKKPMTIKKYLNFQIAAARYFFPKKPEYAAESDNESGM